MLFAEVTADAHYIGQGQSEWNNEPFPATNFSVCSIMDNAVCGKLPQTTRAKWRNN